MACILLPTREWTQACTEVVTQLDDDDELLIICDASSDPVASHPLYDAASDSDSSTIRLLVAGEPRNCSGKANSIATGLEEASSNQDRFVWTDADFVHGDDWLDRIKALGERADGAVSGVPVFTSDDFAWRIYEPAAMFGSLGILTQNAVWAGSVTFTRDHLDLDALVSDLRRTVSDDGLLWRYLATEHGGIGVTTTRQLLYEVPVDGSPRAVMNRLNRNGQILWKTDPEEVQRTSVVLGIMVGLSILAPLYMGILVTVLAGVVYWYLGIRRLTWVFAFPSLFINLVATVVGFVRDEFWWGDRKYRWRSRFDVEILTTRTDE